MGSQSSTSAATGVSIPRQQYANEEGYAPKDSARVVKKLSSRALSQSRLTPNDLAHAVASSRQWSLFGGCCGRDGAGAVLEDVPSQGSRRWHQGRRDSRVRRPTTVQFDAESMSNGRRLSKYQVDEDAKQSDVQLEGMNGDGDEESFASTGSTAMTTTTTATSNATSYRSRGRSQSVVQLASSSSSMALSSRSTRKNSVALGTVMSNQRRRSVRRLEDDDSQRRDSVSTSASTAVVSSSSVVLRPPAATVIEPVLEKKGLAEDEFTSGDGTDSVVNSRDRRLSAVLMSPTHSPGPSPTSVPMPHQVDNSTSSPGNSSLNLSVEKLHPRQPVHFLRRKSASDGDTNRYRRYSMEIAVDGLSNSPASIASVITPGVSPIIHDLKSPVITPSAALLYADAMEGSGDGSLVSRRVSLPPMLRTTAPSQAGDTESPTPTPLRRRSSSAKMSGVPILLSSPDLPNFTRTLSVPRHMQQLSRSWTPSSPATTLSSNPSPAANGSGGGGGILNTSYQSRTSRRRSNSSTPSPASFLHLQQQQQQQHRRVSFGQVQVQYFEKTTMELVHQVHAAANRHRHILHPAFDC